MSALREQQQLSQYDPKESWLKELLQYKEEPDVLENVKGEKCRGKFKVSRNGNCPRCGCSKNVFVILDFLFLMDDMPLILDVLLEEGKAVLWSSQDSSRCKDAPTFLCGGKCPSDPKRGGFNVNWKNVDLAEVYFSEHLGEMKTEPTVQSGKDSEEHAITTSQSKLIGLLPKAKAGNATSGRAMYQVVLEGDSTLSKVESDETSDVSSQVEEGDSHDSFDPSVIDLPFYKSTASWAVLDEEVYDDSVVDATESDSLIKTMLALEAAKVEWAEGTLRTVTTESEASDDDEKDEKDNSNNNTCPVEVDEKKDINGSLAETQTVSSVISPPPAKAGPPPAKKMKFPVSKDGSCPHCQSKDVVYIVLMYKDSRQEDLPPILRRLLRDGHAIQLKKGDFEPPSFQCKGCSYGFNLDWSSASLESIYPGCVEQTVISAAPALSTSIPVTSIPPPMAAPMLQPFQMPYAHTVMPPPPFMMPPLPPVPVPVPQYPMQQWPPMNNAPPYWQDPYYNQFGHHTRPRKRTTISLKWVPPAKKDPVEQSTTSPTVPAKTPDKVANNAESAPGDEGKAEIDFVTKS